VSIRVEVTPGAGAVMRFGEIVIWVGRAASPALVSYLLRGASSGVRVRQLCDQVAAVLRAGDPERAAPFAIVGPTDQGWVALLHGPVQCYDGSRWWVPEPSAGWMGLPVRDPAAVLVGAAGSPVPPLAPDSAYNLERGVVPGGGFFIARPLAARGVPAVEEPAEEGTAGAPSSYTRPAAEHGATEPAPASGEAHETAATAEEIGAPTAAEEIGAAPAVAEETMATEGDSGGTPPAEAADLSLLPGPNPGPLPPVGEMPPPPAGTAVVSGQRCTRGHFNHPASPMCVTCGERLQAGGPVSSGPRPPLGLLIRDDGAVFAVDRPYIMGSDPARDPTVNGGVALPLDLGVGDALAPAHAEIRLDGWQVAVVDRGSRAGTFVLPPGRDSWVRVTPYQPAPLAPGTHLACGQRVLTYTSPWPA
jgi:hypothetical protein